LIGKQWQQWKQTSEQRMKPSEQPPEPQPENPLERIAAEGFDRVNPSPPPFASIALASAMPIAKVRNGALVGAIVTVIAWVAKSYLKVPIPEEVLGAITLIGTVLPSYLTPLKQREIG
jgi:hypothetical protein